MDIDIPITDDFGRAMGNAIRVMEEVKQESDRGTALVMAAMLDEQLELLLTRHFIDDAKVARELLCNSGPLGTFSSRMKVAYCLDLIARELYSDLNTVRKIRNEFAHSHTHSSFDSPRISDLCSNLVSLELIPKLDERLDLSALFDHPNSVRNQFVMRTGALFAWLIVKTSHSASGVVDMVRFIERDSHATGGKHLQALFDEFEGGRND